VTGAPSPPPLAPAAPPMYSYPVVPAAAVHAASQKLPPRRLVIVAGGILLVAVVIITLIVVLVRPSAAPRCTFACGPPQIGPAFISSTAYHNAKWNYSVDFSTSAFTAAATGDDTATLQSPNQLPLITVQAVSGSDVNGAVQTAINNLGSETYQSKQPIGAIPGAEVGEVSGAGQYLTATYVQGNNGIPVAINVIAATRNNFTIVVTVVDQQYQGNMVTGISNWDDAFVVSELRWPGQ
jgi:hypothetical protein